MVRGLLDRFSVLVYIIGGFIGSRPSVGSGDEADEKDGELVEKVLQLMYANQALVGQRGKDYADERLDTAIVYFFHQFRKSYVGDVTLRSSRVYDRLAVSFQLNTVPMVLNVIVQKLCTNLKFWADAKGIVEKSLSLLGEIASGYSSVKLLRKTETAGYMLANHTQDSFAFLGSRENIRSRIVWYSALGRLLASQDENPEGDFKEFIAPFGVVLDELLRIDDMGVFRSEGVCQVLDGIMRDLRGLLSSFQSKKQFMLFFEWFYPYVVCCLKGIQANHDNGVMVSVLRFFAEFVQNKSQVKKRNLTGLEIKF
jgi:exportin-7